MFMLNRPFNTTVYVKSKSLGTFNGIRLFFHFFHFLSTFNVIVKISTLHSRFDKGSPYHCGQFGGKIIAL